MPWTGKSFAKHNKKLSGTVATKVAKQANAILRSGAPEGVAIAVANKHGDKLQAKQRHAGASPKSASEAMADRRGQGLTYRALASEHGTAASTAHRKVKGAALQRGYTRNGGAY